MQTTTVTVNRYELQTTIDMRTGSIIHVVDPGLVTAPTGPIAEFVFSVSVNGLPLGELQNNDPDALRLYVQTRLTTLKPALLRQFQDEFHRMAARHLGDRGWLVSEVKVEIGSLKLIGALMLGFEVLVNYGELRASLDYINKDVTEYAIPFAKQATRQLFDLEAVSPASAATATEEVARQPSASAPIPPAESEEVKLLKEIRDQVTRLNALAAPAAAVPSGDQIHAAETGPP
jgi:hypothetical protein